MVKCSTLEALGRKCVGKWKNKQEKEEEWRGQW